MCRAFIHHQETMIKNLKTSRMSAQYNIVSFAVWYYFHGITSDYVRIRTPRGYRCADACPWDTVGCVRHIWILPAGELERHSTIMWWNLGSTHQRRHVYLQRFSDKDSTIGGLSTWRVAKKPPSCRLPVEWRWDTGSWIQSCRWRLEVVGHSTGQGHVLTCGDRSAGCDPTRWRRVYKCTRMNSVSEQWFIVWERLALIVGYSVNLFVNDDRIKHIHEVMHIVWL